MITVSDKVLFQDGKVNQRTKKLLGNKQFNVIAYLEQNQSMEEEASKISKILDKENLNWIVITFVTTPYQEAKKALEYNSLPEPFGKPLALAMGMDRKPLVLKRDVVASQLQSSEVSLYF